MLAVPIDAWRQRGQHLRLCGRQIFVVDEGEAVGPPLVLLHGFPTASWDWVPIWDRLVAKQRVIAFDFLGFGFSDKPQQHTYSIHEQADLTEALVKELGLDEFHVLAHDYGDTVAQELLARQNEGAGAGRWMSLMLLNGGLFPEAHQARLIQKLLLSPLGSLVSRLIEQRAFSRSFAKVWGPDTQPSAEELQAFWDLICHAGGNRLTHRLIHYMSDRKQHRERWVGALCDATIPLGLINGSIDPVSGAHMVARYRELVGGGGFVAALPTIGHYPQVEAPQATLNAYERFRGQL